MASSLADSYAKVRPAIVAIAKQFSTNPLFPEIVGTGFVADGSGVIVTNDHVIDEISSLPVLKNSKSAFGAKVIIFHSVPDVGMVTVHADILGVVKVDGTAAEPYGVKYDVGLIHVSMRDLPSAVIRRTADSRDGDDVAVAGFPLGTDLLMAQTGGRIGQMTPTLRRGVISAVLPFESDRPTGLLLDIANQGGSSGSPVFDVDTGEVIGLHYGGMTESKPVIGLVGGKPQVVGVVKVHAALSFAVPSTVVGQVVDGALEYPELIERDAEQTSFTELIAAQDWETHDPALGLEAVDPDDIPS